MLNRHLLMIGGVCALGGVVVGSVVTYLAHAPNRSKPAPAATPDQSPSVFFKTFDPDPIVESISGRSFANGEIRTESMSVSGGGLRWGERRYLAFWASSGGLRDQAGASFESQVDQALADAGMESPNPFAGAWIIHPSGAVYNLERRYQAPGHRGKLRGWLIVGDEGQQSTMLLTIDEDV